MKTKILEGKFSISKDFERIMCAFLLVESAKITAYIEYITVNFLMFSQNVKQEVIDNDIVMRIDEVGLKYNFDNSNFVITLYWKYKNGQLPLYPHEEVEEKNIEFWIEGLDEFADRIRERFKSKPQPTLIEGYSFRVEMWRWDGVDAVLEITVQEAYFEQIEHIINEAVGAWNELFEKGKKRNPIHYVGKLEKLEANLCEIHVDTGYASLPALKHIFKSLNKAKIPIEKIEF